MLRVQQCAHFQPVVKTRYLVSCGPVGQSLELPTSLSKGKLEEGLEMLRKSGSWKNFHADSALVKSEAGRYILVGLVEGANGEQQLQTLARAVHQLVQSL